MFFHLPVKIIHSADIAHFLHIQGINCKIKSSSLNALLVNFMYISFFAYNIIIPIHKSNELKRYSFPHITLVCSLPLQHFYE